MVGAVLPPRSALVPGPDLSASPTAIGTHVVTVNVPAPSGGVMRRLPVVRGVPIAKNGAIVCGIARRACTCLLVLVASMGVPCIFLPAIILLPLVHCASRYQIPFLSLSVLLLPGPATVASPSIGEKKVVVVIVGVVVGPSPIVGQETAILPEGVEILLVGDAASLPTAPTKVLPSAAARGVPLPDTCPRAVASALTVGVLVIAAVAPLPLVAALRVRGVADGRRVRSVWDYYSRLSLATGAQ